MGAKQIIKNALDNRIGKETYSLSDISDKTQIVSFDIFDTLVVRDVNIPADVFRIMEDRLGIAGFQKKRIEAEKKAREIKSDTSEVTIDEIYQSYEGITRETISEYIKTELQTEISLCHPNLDIIPFFEQCKEKYKVIIVSDMYLPAEMMRKMLDSCGITSYEKLYVSCDIGKSKYDGNLFEYIAADLKVDISEITHIGDDFKSDYLNARKKRIQTIKVRKQKSKRITSGYALHDYKKNDSDETGIIYNYINNTTNKKESFYYRFGYENVGVLLRGFSKWLINKMSAENVEQVLFIARDGYLMKEVYDTLGYSKEIPSFYFEMSRRSAMIPATFSKGLDYESMLEVIRLPACIKIGQLLEAWGLDEDVYSALIDELGINNTKEYRTSNLQNEKSIRILYERIKNDIESNAKSEYLLFLEYLKEFHFEKKTALVDIGWSATIQKELIKTLKAEKVNGDIRGYYLALDRRAAVNSDGLIAEGYLWDHYNDDNGEMEEGAFVGLIETLFHEQAGSVKGYSYNEEGIYAERYPYEYSLPGGILDEINIIDELQRGTIDFVKSTSNRIVIEDINICKKQSFGFLRDCFVEPSSAMIKKFGNIRYFDMGSFTYLARPKMSLVKYVFKPRSFIIDFYESEWSIGFLKAILKCNISYERLWKALWFIRHMTI